MLYEPTFNLFYTRNRTEIERYLRATANRYRHIVEEDDMFQEIVLRLINSTFLQDWDEKKSALNTFFTNRIRGYALHVVKDKLKEYCLEKIKDSDYKLPIFLPLDKYHEYSEHDSAGSPYNKELAEEPTEEEDAYFREIIKTFKERVTAEKAEIYILHWKGYGYHEIEEIIRTVVSRNHPEKSEFKSAFTKPLPYMTVRNRCVEATKVMHKILTSDGDLNV